MSVYVCACECVNVDSWCVYISVYTNISLKHYDLCVCTCALNHIVFMCDHVSLTYVHMYVDM